MKTIGTVVLTVVAVVAAWGALRADDAAAERSVRPLPPIDTELSRLKDVSIIRIEESEAEDDIWDHRGGFWRFEQHSRRSGRVRIKDETLLQALCGEAHVSPMYVFGSELLPDGRYNVTFKSVPKTDARSYTIDELSRALEASFQLSIAREMREVPVLTLQPIEGGVEILKKSLNSTLESEGVQSISTSSDGDGVTDVEYQGSLVSFAEYLEEELGEAVVNKVQLTGQVTLRFDHESVPESEDSDYDFFSAATLTELRRRRLEDIDNGLRQYGLSLRRTHQRVKGIFVAPRSIEHAGTTATDVPHVAGAASK